MEHTNIKLPPYAKFSPETGLRWKKLFIGNFVPIVSTVIELQSDTQGKQDVELFVLFTDGSCSEPRTISVSKLKDVDWFALDNRCQIDPDCPKAGVYLASIVQLAMQDYEPLRKTSIDQPGVHELDGRAVFCKGDRLYPESAENDTEIHFVPPPISLDIDTNLSEQTATKAMLSAVRLHYNVGIMLILQVLLSIMRSVFTSIGIPPSCVLFLVGDSGLGKTQFASLLVQIYNRAKGLAPTTQLTSSFPALKDILSDPLNTDQTVLVDDMFPSDITEIRRKFEAVFTKLVRLIGNQNSPAMMSGKTVTEKPPKCGVIIIGEYPSGLRSDAARCLIVELTSSVLGERLHWFQQRQLFVPTFYSFYINWFIDNYDSIKNLLAKWLENFRKSNLGVNAHLQDTYFCFASAHKLFLQYCVAKGFTSINNAWIEQRNFEDLLMHLVQKQNERVYQDIQTQAKKPDVFELIKDLYRNGFEIAKSKKKYDANPSSYDALIHNEMLCVPSETLMTALRSKGYTYTANEIRTSLLDNEALKLDSESKNYKIGSKRFYGIYLSKLK